MMRNTDFFPLFLVLLFLTWAVSLRVHTHGSRSLSPFQTWFGLGPQRQGFDDDKLLEGNNAI